MVNKKTNNIFLSKRRSLEAVFSFLFTQPSYLTKLDFMEEAFEEVAAFQNAQAKAQNMFLPKEEELNEEEFDRMMEEQYNRGPGFGAFAEENYENKNSTGKNPPLQSAKDTISLWKVKCMVWCLIKGKNASAKDGVYILHFHFF